MAALRFKYAERRASLARLAAVPSNQMRCCVVAFFISRIAHGIFYIVEIGRLRFSGWVGAAASPLALMMLWLIAANG